MFELKGTRGIIISWVPVPIKKVLPVICFCVSVESDSFSSCRALAIPPQCWTSSLLSWSLNTRFLRAPAAAWLTPGLALRSRVTRAGIPPIFKTWDTKMSHKGINREHAPVVLPSWTVIPQMSCENIQLPCVQTCRVCHWRPVWCSPLCRWCVEWRWLHIAGNSHLS